MSDFTDQKAYCEDKINANLDASKKKKPHDIGTEKLAKVKDIGHVVKRKVHQISSGSGKIMALAWGSSPTDSRLAVCDQEGSLFVWDTTRTTPLRLYGCVSPFAQSVALSPDEANPAILVGGMHNATVLFKKGSGPILEKKKTWTAHDGYISSLAFLDSSKYISSSGDADIRVFDLSSADNSKGIQTLRGHEKDAQSIKFPRDVASKNVFITCSSDKTCKMWDLRANMCTHTFQTDSELNACAIFPDGNLVACGGEKDKTYVFDVRGYTMVNKYCRNNMKTASVEFSKSGRELFVGHDDGALIVWDIFGCNGENKSYAKKIEAHTTMDAGGKVDQSASRIQILDIAPSGFLASGGFDGKVNIWGAPPDQ